MEETIELTEEQKQAMRELVKVLEHVCKTIKEFVISIWNEFRKIIEGNSKIKKCLAIYNRTHNKRIKKKQIARIRKILNE